MHVVNNWKYSSAHAQGGVSGVAYVIAFNEQLPETEAANSSMQVMLPKDLPFFLD